MSFSDQIKRVPIPHQPEMADGVREAFCDVSEPFRELLAGVAGCSPYLAGLIEKQGDWLRLFETTTPEALRAGVLDRVSAADSPGELKRSLRHAKAQIALLTALADIAEIWPLEAVTGTLTEFADSAVDAGLRALLRVEYERGKLPALSDADMEAAGGISVLAMGKMGAGELNYSSDIDLICLFDESRYEPGDYMDIRSGFVKIIRRLMALMSDNTEDGYVFRTDLRLRPDASVTPVIIAMEAAERYYESVGRTWERAAFIKARAAAGDLAAGEAFLERLSPFIWRRHLDFAAIQDAHDMRLRIRDHKGLGGKFELAGHDMKLGAGGIREIEFFTQTRQIIAGGRDPALRVRGTLDGLDRLVEAGWVEAPVRDTLQAAYVEHRRVEHRLQMIADAQTHHLPKTEEGFQRLVQFLGRDDVGAWRDDVTERLSTVAHLTEAFFAPDQPQSGEARPEVETHLEKWRSFPALRSSRSREIFRRLFPEILERLRGAADPEDALHQFERFISGLPAGVQLFSMFEANPSLSQLIADICATSPALAGYLSRNSKVFDAVIGGDFFTEWPGVAGLAAELSAEMARTGDYEAQLDAARRWQKEWHFRIGVHHLRGLISPDEAGAQYAELAEAVLQGLLPVVVAQFASKHGDPPGHGAALLAMGSLGAGRLSASSDLDLIIIYDADGVESSEGRRPLMVTPYFARFTQTFITALTAPTAEGKLYEVDMRLRPSGRAGPVATSLSSFESYQKTQAWVWEHLALTRARVVAGAMTLAERIEAVRREVLGDPREATQVLKETQEMRTRLREAGRLGGVWETKDGPGGQKDIELMAQAATVVAGGQAREVLVQLGHVAELGWLSAEQVEALRGSHDLFWRLQHAARLLSDQPLDLNDVGQGGRDLVLRDCEAADQDALEQRLRKCREQAEKLVDSVLAQASLDGNG